MIRLRYRARTDGKVKPTDVLALGLGCAGVAAQICYPLTDGAARDLVTVAVVLLLAGACVAHAAATRGARWATGLVLITVGGGLLAEFLGTTTGFPFGGYTYTTNGAFGPEMGSVPLLIGPAWTVGGYPAWCAAQAVTGGRRGAVTVPAAAVGLAGWDLYLDPQMVADGRWAWVDPGPALPGVPQVPLSNYAGWLLVAGLLCGALHQLDRALGAARPGPDRLPQVLFCWTWLGSAVAHAVFLGLPASAGYGLAGMGLIGVPLLGRLPRAFGMVGRCPPSSPIVSDGVGASPPPTGGADLDGASDQLTGLGLAAADELTMPSRASTSRVERDRFRV